MDWRALVHGHWQRSARATADLLSRKYPSLGSAESIRKNREFLEHWSNKLKEIQGDETIPVSRTQTLPRIDNPIQELLEAKCREAEKRIKNKQESDVTVMAMGAYPIAIVHFGDPHLDDPGCDLPKLRNDCLLVSSTPGAYGGNIGDTINNWIGKLSKLYAKQSTTFEEALMLAEWFAHSIPWIYWVMGNHDHWDHGSTILKLLLRGADVRMIAAHDARIALKFDNGVQVNIRARHDWRGRSQYNTVHGTVKGHIFGDRWADLAVGGHTHQWGVWQSETEDGKPRWGMRVRGYKRIDDYAAEKGLYDHQFGSSCCTIIDPYAPPTERIKCYWDVEYGLKILTVLRR